MAKQCLTGMVLLIIFLFAAFNVQLFASGRRDTANVQTQNNEWILCITRFDVSALPAEKQFMSEVLLKQIVESLTSISYRARISPEYTYYENFAWANARSTAARALVARTEERSRFIYQGEPRWRYRRNIDRLDTDIKKLRDALENIEKQAPVINREPVFNLTRGNLDLTFPEAPAAGTEFRFCTTQRADGLLTGSISDFHGRYLLTVQLYTVYTRSFVWEDSVIFSHDDLNDALFEFMRKLLIVLSGNEPAVIAITAEPEETLVLINRAFAGRGNTDLIEMPPATVTITATAPNHDSITFETVLSPDELTSIQLRLNPVRFVDVDIMGDRDGRVYQGALYVGDAPLTMRLPIEQLEYIELQTYEMRRGTIVFETPELPEAASTVSLRTRIPLPRGRVDRDRRIFYWAWGSTWITGAGAWIAYYSYEEADNAIRLIARQNGGSIPAEYADFHKAYMDMYYISMGAIIITGAAALYTVYRGIRYLYTSNRSRTPITTPRRN